MVYWVVARRTPLRAVPAQGRALIERLGPFDSVARAVGAKLSAATRYRERPEIALEIVCDFA